MELRYENEGFIYLRLGLHRIIDCASAFRLRCCLRNVPCVLRWSFVGLAKWSIRCRRYASKRIPQGE
ncbi:hypothetical protein bas12_0076 [Escherichia phage BrunoManser]|uniref:Uncharacterized protein n=1 Tax=Escherichia phage BrunoManser TaxID=2851976 RepID=A0AAE8AZC8_9CAUD|nr:hypothetical protein bas12_0076 [Escherichia phage BrunoManser]